MDKLDGEEIIRRYTDWLRDSSQSDCYNDVWKIELPLLNRRRSWIQIFATRTESGVLLSDYGETIGDLRFSGFDIDDTEIRREQLNRILRSFGVTLVGKDELQILTSEEELPDYMNELVQCMLTVDLMIYTAPHKVAQLYEEDTQAALKSEKKRLAATRS